jgi:hypothetical protein
MILSQAQSQNIARVIDAYCQANNTTWQDLTPDQAPAIAQAMNVHGYDSVADAIAQVLTKQA